MKKSMFSLLSSLAVSALLFGYAGSAAATPFGDDSDDRKSKKGGKVSLSDDDSDSDRKSKSRPTFLRGGFDDDSDSDSDRKSKNHPKVARGEYDDDSDSDGRPGTYPKPKPGTDPVPAIPEPSAALIFAAGLTVAGLRRRS